MFWVPLALHPRSVLLKLCDFVDLLQENLQQLVFKKIIFLGISEYTWNQVEIKGVETYTLGTLVIEYIQSCYREVAQN